MKETPQNSPKYQISAKSVREFGSYKHLKFRPTCLPKYVFHLIPYQILGKVNKFQRNWLERKMLHSKHKFGVKNTPPSAYWFKRGKAPGPNTIHNEVLRLGTTTSLFHHLAKLFTSSIQLSYIPTAWKIATLCMLLKPDKLQSLTLSYRPTSLIS